MAVSWFRNNEKFYAMSTGSVDNVVVTEFESGKNRMYLRNSTGRKSHQVSFTLWKKTEEIAFWNWYDNVLMSRSEYVQLTDFISGSGTKLYQMTEEPSIPDSQYPKECQVTFEEA